MRTSMTRVLLIAAALAITPLAASADVATLGQDESKSLSEVMPRSNLAGEQIYFMMTDRYANGLTSNDQGAGVSQGGFNRSSAFGFHGGDFVGAAANLDRLKRLGFTAIWITPPVVQNPVQGSTSAYHGYWGIDFTTTDPHLGTEEEFRQLVQKAHGLGIRVYVDVVLNHTGDIIRYRDGESFIPVASKPYKDATGQVVDLSKVAGLPRCTAATTTKCFPTFSASTSFPKDVYVPLGYDKIKSPSWLNDITLYHNRGDANACNWAPGECSEMGDFFGLDDIMTENPVVIDGWVEVIASWIKRFDIDGLRIDTAKHVDPAFFKAWVPKMQAAAKAAGKTEFPMFGEAWETTPESLATYVRDKRLPSVLDFAFQSAAVAFSSGKRSGSSFLRLFGRDDWFNTGTTNGGLSNAYSLVTFLGNHDMGRAALMIAQQSQAAGTELLKRVQLATTTMYLSRGVPVVYYGDEVGMIGTGGDAAARQDMFATSVSTWKTEARVGAKPIGSQSSLTPTAEKHPLAQQIAKLSKLRAQYPALASGAFLPREGAGSIASWSRFGREEPREFVVVVNAGKAAGSISVSTSTPDSAFKSVYGNSMTIRSSKTGTLVVKLPALSTVVLRADQKVPAPATLPNLEVESYADPLVGAPIVRVLKPGIADPMTVTFVARSCPSCAWIRLGSDDAATYQLVVHGIDVTKSFEIAAIARLSDGRIVSGPIYRTDPADFTD